MPEYPLRHFRIGDLIRRTEAISCGPHPNDTERIYRVVLCEESGPTCGDVRLETEDGSDIGWWWGPYFTLVTKSLRDKNSGFKKFQQKIK